MITSAFTPVKIGPVTLKNRFVKAATNEGMCKEGVVSKGLANFHARMAKGGVAMTTVAYCATSKDGQTFVDQAHLSADTVPDFKVLTRAFISMGARLRLRSPMLGLSHFYLRIFHLKNPFRRMAALISLA